MTKNFTRTLRKVRHYYMHTWCAYCTPQEFITLVQAGAVPRQRDLARAKQCRAAGDCVPTYYYFEVRRRRGQLMSLLDKRMEVVRRG